MRDMKKVAAHCDSRIELQTPVGDLWAGFCGDQLVCILWGTDQWSQEKNKIPENTTDTANITSEFTEAYFGQKPSVKKLSTELLTRTRSTGTMFQENVWNQLRTIPYGQTLSYLDVAKSRWSPNHARPIAAAIAKNPLSILVPCHRVIASSGKLQGFAGGLKAKRKLLELEVVDVDRLNFD